MNIALCTTSINMTMLLQRIALINAECSIAYIVATHQAARQRTRLKHAVRLRTFYKGLDTLTSYICQEQCLQRILRSDALWAAS
eukprot:3451-Heterococcus_DN1.PRE.6